MAEISQPMSFHAAAAGEVQPEQSEKDNSAVKMVQKIHGRLKKERAPISKDWPMYQRFYNGNQYRNNTLNVTDDAPKKIGDNIKVPFNVMQASIQGMVPILTDLNPSFEALPDEPNDFKLALIFSDILEDFWRKHDMQIKLVEWVTDSLVIDSGIAKTVWNPELNSGIGDPECRVINPAMMWANFEATGFKKSQGCKVVQERITKDVATWKRLFPDQAEFIRADTKTPTRDGDGKESTGIQSPVDQVSQFDNQKDQASNDGDVAEALETWIDDDTMVEFEEEDENGEKKKGLKKKFPNGRHIIVLDKQNLLLLDAENPYKGDDFNPYDILKDRVVPRQLWGEGEVRHSIDMQKLFNKLVNDIANYINKMGNPWILNPAGSGIRNSRFTNQMALILSYNGQEKPTREFPPDLPAEYFNFVNFIEGFFRKIFGTGELSEGRRPAGIKSGDAIEALQEAEQTRLRLKERNQETFLSSVGTKVVARYMQFAREPRIVRTTGKEGWPSFFEFTIADTDAEGQPLKAENGADQVQVSKVPFKQMVNPETKVQESLDRDEAGIETTDPSAGLMDIKVVSGTSAPFEKTKRKNEAFKLFQDGVITSKRLLEIIEFPNAEAAILEKQEEDKQLAAQQPPEGAPQGVQ